MAHPDKAPEHLSFLEQPLAAVTDRRIYAARHHLRSLVHAPGPEEAAAEQEWATLRLCDDVLACQPFLQSSESNAGSFAEQLNAGFAFAIRMKVAAERGRRQMARSDTGLMAFDQAGIDHRRSQERFGTIVTENLVDRETGREVLSYTDASSVIAAFGQDIVGRIWDRYREIAYFSHGYMAGDYYPGSDATLMEEVWRLSERGSQAFTVLMAPELGDDDHRRLAQILAMPALAYAERLVQYANSLRTAWPPRLTRPQAAVVAALEAIAVSDRTSGPQHQQADVLARKVELLPPSLWDAADDD